MDSHKDMNVNKFRKPKPSIFSKGEGAKLSKGLPL